MDTVTCNVCGFVMDAPQIVSHLRLVHDSEDVETWPDGELVVVDDTLNPEDF